ncbi:hypothetical protein P7L75_10885 [Tistrella mobilis]|uniref:hypothetical protein n=1 Tax=Tistrella mobilis TaxID=171437 RepID=UPI003556B5DA
MMSGDGLTRNEYRPFASKMTCAVFVFLVLMNGFAGALPVDAPAAVALFVVAAPVYSVLVLINLKSVPYPKFSLFVLVSLMISLAQASTMYNLAFNIYYASAALFIILVFYMIRNRMLSITSIFRYTYISIAFAIYFSVFDFLFLVSRSGGLYRGTWGYSLFFDDKSHYTVFIGFFLFLGAMVLRDIARERKLQGVYPSIWFSRVVPLWIVFNSVVALMMSSTTMSRLIVFFVPAFVFQVYYAVECLFFLGKRYDQHKKVSLFYVFTLIFLIIGLIVFIAAGDAIVNNPTFRRVIMVLEQQQDNSFKAHVLLIELAIRSKFLSLSNFIFGVGLGNYQHEILENGLALELTSHMSVYRTAARGYLPAHSVWGTLWIEANIAMFLVVMCGILWIVAQGIIRGVFAASAFALGLIGSSMFYNTINEPFYFVMWLCVIASIFHNRYDWGGVVVPKGAPMRKRRRMAPSAPIQVPSEESESPSEKLSMISGSLRFSAS